MAACRLCRERPRGLALPHEPRPIFRVSRTARLLIASQAPGRRAHESGVPFLDPSGTRLREWLALGHDDFYDASRLAIVPMGFCFPGNDAAGGDLPPRAECAPLWRQRVLATMPQVSLILLIGAYSQAWHLASERRATLTETVAGWREILDAPRLPRLLPLPHPSWRNSGWLKRHPWFEAELLPRLRAEVRDLMG